MTMSDGGKGDTYRKVDLEKWSKNYDNIFGKNKGVRVSGVPYEVDLSDMIMELERENFMLRARNQRLEEELERTRDDGK
jgi:hypothetical protein